MCAVNAEGNQSNQKYLLACRSTPYKTTGVSHGAKGRSEAARCQSSKAMGRRKRRRRKRKREEERRKRRMREVEERLGATDQHARDHGAEQ